MDGFGAGDTAMDYFVGLLMEMLDDADAARRAHAFSVMLNCAMHALLIADITTVEGGIRAELILEMLFRQLCDLLSNLYLRQEREERVWTAAFNTFLFFARHNIARCVCCGLHFQSLLIVS